MMGGLRRSAWAVEGVEELCSWWLLSVRMPLTEMAPWERVESEWCNVEMDPERDVVPVVSSMRSRALVTHTSPLLSLLLLRTQTSSALHRCERHNAMAWSRVQRVGIEQCGRCEANVGPMCGVCGQVRTRLRRRR